MCRWLRRLGVRSFSSSSSVPQTEQVRLPNPLVYMDISVGKRNAGRLVFQLFADVLPITSENFRCLCTGETGLGYYLQPRWYRGTPFHRIIPGFMAQGGDIHRGDGYGGESIYGQFFRDERFLYRHSKRGLLSMAKCRWNHTNNSQFFVTFAPCPWLDGEHVVFGQLESGEETLAAIEEAGSEGGWCRRRVEVFDCGELQVGRLLKTHDTEEFRKQELPLAGLAIDVNQQPLPGP